MENRELWIENLKKHPDGLTLGGGGARGCYEIGLWKAFDEEKIRFSCVSGTSIGALVGAMYVQDSLKEMTDFVLTLHPQKIAKDLFAMPETLEQLASERKEIGSFLQEYILSRKGMDISPLRQALEKMFSYQKFHDSRTNFACMTFNVTLKRPEAYFKSEMTPENARDIILASASCYPAFPVMEMNGNDYIDGGYWDNLPVDLAARMGAENILAVNVQGPGVILPVDPSLHVFEIKPVLPLGNFLDFSASSAVKSMKAGYLETCRLLGKQCGLFYSFPASQKGELSFLEGSISFMFELNRIQISDSQLHTILRWTTGCSDSDLFQMLSQKADCGSLIESLAYLAGVDAWKSWNTVEEFKNELLFKLSELSGHFSDWKTFYQSLTGGELDRLKAISLFHWMIEQHQGSSDQLQAFASVYPGEVALAWCWYFVEGLYGEQKTRT